MTTGNYQCAGEVDRLRVPIGPLAAMLQYSSADADEKMRR